MTRILLVGAHGQVGCELQRSLAPLGEVICVGRETVDLACSSSIRQVIVESKPTVIVNAAAYTAVDKAELETKLARSINAEAPTVMAEEAQRLGATLIHLSTDYVFDGRKNKPYLEQDRPNPVSVYGQSKWQGEEGIRQVCEQYLILRTAWVYGTYGKSNFVKTMLRLGAEREELRVVADQVGSPTWAGDIADAIAQLVPQFLPNSETTATLKGIYHFTNSGVASWYDFAVAIFEEARQLGFPLQLKQVIPITTAEYPTPAQRPAYSVLSCRKIASVLGNHPPYWRDSLRTMLEQFYQQSHPVTSELNGSLLRR